MLTKSLLLFWYEMAINKVIDTSMIITVIYKQDNSDVAKAVI